MLLSNLLGQEGKRKEGGREGGIADETQTGKQEKEMERKAVFRRKRGTMVALPTVGHRLSHHGHCF